LFIFKIFHSGTSQMLPQI